MTGAETRPILAPLRAPCGLDSPAPMNEPERTFSPGLKGVMAGETSLAMIDGDGGRLQYRGYPIGELVANGTYGQVAELLWTGDWKADAHLACAPLPEPVLEVLRRLPPPPTRWTRCAPRSRRGAP